MENASVGLWSVGFVSRIGIESENGNGNVCRSVDRAIVRSTETDLLIVNVMDSSASWVRKSVHVADWSDWRNVDARMDETISNP